MVDTEGFKRIDRAAKLAENKVKIGQWEAATQYWAYTQSVVLQNTYNVDFYNILTKITGQRLKHNLKAQDVLSFDGGKQSRNAK